MKTVRVGFEFLGLCSRVVFSNVSVMLFLIIEIMNMLIKMLICRQSGATLSMTYCDSVFVFQFCGILGTRVMLRRG